MVFKLLFLIEIFEFLLFLLRIIRVGIIPAPLDPERVTAI